MFGLLWVSICSQVWMRWQAAGSPACRSCAPNWHRVPPRCARCAGCKYELPQYVLSEPSNLLRERRNSSSKQRPGSGGGGGQQVELPVAAAGS